MSFETQYFNLVYHAPIGAYYSKSGSLFSMKEATPSAKSGVIDAAVISALSNSNCVSKKVEL